MKSILLSAALVLCGVTMASSQTMPTEAQLASAQYMGVRTCRPCHMKTAKGEMYEIWEASKHAKAFEALASEASIALATTLGIDNAQESETCLQCHSTAGTQPAERVHARYANTEGVGCEACHGAGKFYRSKKLMCKVSSGEIEGSVVGLVTPTEATCAGCHAGEAPEGHPSIEFDYEAAVQTIAHPLPAERTNGQGCVKK
jgi:hypothetical protein